MKKHIRTAVSLVVLILLLVVQYFVQSAENRKNAFNTDTILIEQVESIIVSNRKKEQVLVDSLK